MKKDDAADAARLSDAVLEVLHDETAENRDGLLLIDMPTGYGKSYAAQQFLPRFVLDEANRGRNIFYITNQKKNLPKREDMIRAFAACGVADSARMVDEQTMWVQSVVDMMEENATEELDREIPLEFKGDKWKSLLQAAVNYREMKGNPSVPNGYRTIAEESLRIAERAFRAYVSKLLSEPDSPEGEKKGKKAKPLTLKKRIRRVELDPRWQWLGRLYPTVFTRRRRIFLMSVNKFLVSNISVVEGGYRFIDDDKLMKDAVVIIDEFDGSKAVLQQDIIKNSVRGKAEPIALLKQIHKAFEDDGFPSEMTRVPKDRNLPSDRIKSTLERMKDVVSGTYDDCRLRYNFKSDDEPGWQDFIFHDHEYRCASDKRYYVTFDPAERHNRLVSSKKEADGEPLTHILGRVRGALQYSQNGISLIAENYQKLENARRGPDEAEFSYENALYSILDQFGIVGDSAKEFMASGASSPFRRGGKKKLETADLRGDYSVYERGIHFVHLENSEEHKERTRVSMYAMQDTPEKTILRLCEKNFIVGLSATGTIDSVLCNYDLRYFKDSLGERFRTLSARRMETMRKAFEGQNAGYENVSIETTLIDDADDGWRGAFGDAELAVRMRRLAASRKGGGKDDDYGVSRYLRLCIAFRSFLEHDDIKSMLCLTMAAPRPGGAIDSETLTALFDALVSACNASLPQQEGKAYAFISGSRNFDAEYAGLKSRLEAGEKLFIVAAYDTVGTGVNLQYRIPKGVETCKIYEFDNGCNEKDFDAIYLDRPTNTAPWLSPAQNNEAGLLDNLYRMCELRERAEVDESEYVQAYTALLSYFATQKQKKGRFMPKGLKERPSAKAFATKTVNQAVGRICRTPNKNKTVYLFADAGLADTMDLDFGADGLINNEYAALVGALKERRVEGSKPFKYRLESRAALQSDKLNQQILSTVRYKSWNAEKVQWWRRLRDASLRHPTLADPDADRFAKRVYAEAGMPIAGYSYDEVGDYGSIQGISFESVDALSKAVSEEAAALPTILEIPGVRGLFEGMGWATGFAPARHIMTPVIFNNIYKGALGEAVGKFILEQRLPEIALSEIDDAGKFERFDYVVKGTDVYVDFKHWQGFCGDSETAEFERVREKMHEVGAKQALVVNLLGCAEDGYEYALSSDHAIMTVPYLYDVSARELSDENLTRICMFLKMGGLNED
ncbi:MAG: hypothetical protein Q4C41_03760 [Eggerthellaceae bacterium]|nr:hypothetical protein [Eggerthellaceae bacterium]